MAFQMRITEFSQPVQKVLIDVFGFKELDLVNEDNLDFRHSNFWDDEVDETTPKRLIHWELIDESEVDLDKMAKQVTKGTFQEATKKKANKMAIKKHACDTITGEFQVEYEIENSWGVLSLMQRTFIKKTETDVEYDIRQNRLKHEIYLDKAIQEMKELEANLKN